jgi:hypothetical protein
VCADKGSLAAKVGDKLIDLAGGAVVHRDREAMVGDIAGEILAHDGEAGKAKVRFLTQKFLLRVERFRSILPHQATVIKCPMEALGNNKGIQSGLNGEQLQRWGWFGAAAQLGMMLWLASDLNEEGGYRPQNAFPFLLGCALASFWCSRFWRAYESIPLVRKGRLKYLGLEAVLVCGIYSLWATGTLEKLLFQPAIPSLTRFAQTVKQEKEGGVVILQGRKRYYSRVHLNATGELWVYFHEYHSVNDYDAALVYSRHSLPSRRTGLMEPLGGGWYRYFERGGPRKRGESSSDRASRSTAR